MDFQNIDFQNIVQGIMPWFFSHGIKIVVILIGAVLLIRFSKIFIEKFVRKLIKPEQVAKDPDAERKREDTLIKIFNSTLTMIIWAIAVLMILPELGIDISGIFLGAGIIGVAVGFGAQYMIRDFLAGLFIMLENQYRVGDVIQIAGIGGKVEDITLRKTVLRDIDGAVHHIPNGEIKVASNKSQEFSRVHLKIGVAYKENIDHVSQVLNQIGRELAEDPKWKSSILKTPEVIGIDEFADSAIIIKVLGETMPLKQWEIGRELRRRIKITFDKEGIEIPFPQVSVWQRSEQQKQ
ncbi:mechanosensitive ion channel family protein [Candidatus Parcubacteria bacterium]|nr:mechanosensitive ion channel family protein [Candidatus Parcubacteria bacterium]